MVEVFRIKFNKGGFEMSEEINIRKREFDYYIYIDYSENFLGYLILNANNFKNILPKILRLRHYKNARNRKLYLKNVKKTIKKKRIQEFFCKLKIRELRFTPEIYSDIVGFISKYREYNIFISIDDSQYNNFKKLVDVLNGKNVLIKRESELKKGSSEYQLSLLLDNLLNIERAKK